MFGESREKRSMLSFKSYLLEISKETLKNYKEKAQLSLRKNAAEWSETKTGEDDSKYRKVFRKRHRGLDMLKRRK